MTSISLTAQSRATTSDHAQNNHRQRSQQQQEFNGSEEPRPPHQPDEGRGWNKGQVIWDGSKQEDVLDPIRQGCNERCKKKPIGQGGPWPRCREQHTAQEGVDEREGEVEYD